MPIAPLSLPATTIKPHGACRGCAERQGLLPVSDDYGPAAAR